MVILIAEDDAISRPGSNRVVKEVRASMLRRHGQRVGCMGSVPERKPSAPHFRIDDALHRWGWSSCRMILLGESDEVRPISSY